MALDAIGPAIGLGWLPLERARSLVVQYALNHPAQLEQLLEAPLTSPRVWQLVAQHQWLFFYTAC